MVNTRNILLIGRTGNGKSTLGNVLVNNINENGNYFEKFETVFSEFATSEIKYKIKYR